jgi:hypothetical protein
MLINRDDILSLKELFTSTEPIEVESIPIVFKQDFNLFFFGKTLLKKDNLLFAYPNDIKAWILFMFKKYNG